MWCSALVVSSLVLGQERACTDSLCPEDAPLFQRVIVCPEDAPLFQRADHTVPELGPLLDILPLVDDTLDTVILKDAQNGITLDHDNFGLEQLVEMKFVDVPTGVSTKEQSSRSVAEGIPLRMTTAALAVDRRALAEAELLLITNDPGPQLLETESAETRLAEAEPLLIANDPGLQLLAIESAEAEPLLITNNPGPQLLATESAGAEPLLATNDPGLQLLATESAEAEPFLSTNDPGPQLLETKSAEAEPLLITNDPGLQLLATESAEAEPFLSTNHTGPQLFETESARTTPPSNWTASNYTSRWTGLPGSPLLLLVSMQSRKSSSVATIAVSILLGLCLVAGMSVCWLTNTTQAQHSSKRLYTTTSAGTNSSLPAPQRRGDSKSSRSSTQSSTRHYSPSLRQVPPKAQLSSGNIPLAGAGKVAQLAQVVAKMPCLNVRCRVPPDNICLLSLPSLQNAGFDQMLNITNFGGTTLLWTKLSKESHGADKVEIYDLDKHLLACCSVDPSKAQDETASFLILDKKRKPYATITREVAATAATHAQTIFRVRPQRAIHTSWDLALRMDESPGQSHIYLRDQFIAQFVSTQPRGYEGHFASGGDCALLLLCFSVGELIVHKAARSGSCSREGSARP